MCRAFLAGLLLGICLPSMVSASTVLVPAGADWKYLDDGSDQGVAWREPGFDDAAWAEGSAQLGYGDGDEVKVIGYGPDPSLKYVTTYFRHGFVVTDPAAFACLRFRLLRDDGAVICLNGTEIGRSNMPAGTIDYLTFAKVAVSDPQEDAFQVWYVYPDELKAGTNVLAVEIHQVSRSSSDLSFNLELTGLTELPVLMRKAPYVLYRGSNTAMQLCWQLILSDTCLVEWGTDQTYSLGSEETIEYGDDHQHAKIITGLAAGTKYFYRVTAGAEEYRGSFRAAPADDAIAVKFLAYGDTRSYPADHDAVAERMLATYETDPAFQTLIISVGDLVAHGDNEDDWDTQFFAPSYSNIKAMLGNLAYQSCMGNHEESGALFTEYFPYPFVGGRYWSFDYGPAHFVVVDQYTSYGPGSAQLTWIENDLAGTGKPWKFVYLHEPGWSAGSHPNNISVQNYIQPLCEQYGVHMVFAGHNHYYARAVVNGVQHITTGGGGAPLYEPILTYPNVVTATKAHHFCKVEIDGGILHLEVKTSQDSLIDSLTISLPGADVESPESNPAGEEPDLGAAFPNPFTQEASIQFSVCCSSRVKLGIYDTQGRRVRALVDDPLEAGDHGQTWDGMDDSGLGAPPGVYFCRLESKDRVAVRKLVLLN